MKNKLLLVLSVALFSGLNALELTRVTNKAHNKVAVTVIKANGEQQSITVAKGNEKLAKSKQLTLGAGDSLKVVVIDSFPLAEAVKTENWLRQLMSPSTKVGVLVHADHTIDFFEIKKGK